MFRYNLNLIRNICLASLSFTLGVGMVYNLIFLITGKWYTEPAFTIVIIIVYGFFVVNKFIDFIIGILTNPNSLPPDI